MVIYFQCIVSPISFAISSHISITTPLGFVLSLVIIANGGAEKYPIFSSLENKEVEKDAIRITQKKYVFIFIFIYFFVSWRVYI
jgi:hypothetical protein